MATNEASNDRRSGPYVCTGGETVLAYDFRVLQATDLAVWQRAVTGVERRLDFAEYSVSGVGAEVGGNVTLVVPAANGEIYLLLGDRPETRTSDLVGERSLSIAAINGELDALTMAIRELRRDLDAMPVPPAIAGDGFLDLPPRVVSTPSGEAIRLFNQAGVLRAKSTTFDINLLDGGGGGGGSAGWTPLFAAVADGSRRVLQVVDWIGGEGIKPTVGLYIGPAGLVVAAANATDVRGAAGVDGSTSAQLPMPPQGRLSLVAGSAIMASSVAGATALRYEPRFGKYAPLWDGSAFAMKDLGGALVQATTDATKSPAACAGNKNYDGFCWIDGVTPRISRGPAWQFDYDRGVGAGSSELEFLNGLPVNKYDIVNGPAARRGLYVGTVRTNASAQIDWVLGGTASGGTPASLHVWNAFNAVSVCAEIFNSVASYPWAPGSATFRAAGNTNNMRVSFVTGLQVDPIKATYEAVGANTNAWMVGVGIDRATGFDGSLFYGAGTTAGVGMVERSMLGYHYAQAVEWTASGTTTFFGQPATGATYGLYMSLAGKF